MAVSSYCAGSAIASSDVIARKRDWSFKRKQKREKTTTRTISIYH